MQSGYAHESSAPDKGVLYGWVVARRQSEWEARWIALSSVNQNPLQPSVGWKLQQLRGYTAADIYVGVHTIRAKVADGRPLSSHTPLLLTLGFVLVFENRGSTDACVAEHWALLRDATHETATLRSDR